jgi:sterol desaturase/sphingolipid hydroxylase (fatty acid hydroxylase superfamily)
MFYNYFITSFSLSSLGCFLHEWIDPKVRINDIDRSQILANYQKMLPTVATNLLIAYPCFSISEKHLHFDNLVFSSNYVIINFMLWYLNFVYYFFAWIMLTDLLFYSVHRMLHTRQMYWLHAKHHSFRYTHAVGAIYSSVFEFVVGNLATAGLPIYILSIPENYVKMIIIFASVYTSAISHSGFKSVSKGHFTHHLKYKVNYGLAFLDRALGTKG